MYISKEISNIAKLLYMNINLVHTSMNICKYVLILLMQIHCQRNKVK
jgi:hypothetical protein